MKPSGLNQSQELAAPGARFACKAYTLSEVPSRSICKKFLILIAIALTIVRSAMHEILFVHMGFISALW